MKNIIFYAASSINVPKHKIGGAECGAKRTYEHLINNGYNVTYIPKINKTNGIIAFIFGFIKTYFVLSTLFKKERSNGIFYITSFYKRQARIEYLFIHRAKKRNLSIIYEPKNGSFVKHYNDDGTSYRQIIDKTLKDTDIVFCQGLSDVSFFNCRFGNKAIYIPNYVNKFVCKYPTNNGILNIVYFGRITESKNIDLILRVCSILTTSFVVSCTIIGQGNDKYTEYIKNEIKLLNLDSIVKLIGYSTIDTIRQYCGSVGFFLFPSSEEEEGHSNSLTEAMSFGLIPIVSDNGFNKTVVGDERFVVKTLDAKDYAKRVLELYKDVDNSVNYVLKRVEHNFTSEVVIKRQIDAIKVIADC